MLYIQKPLLYSDVQLLIVFTKDNYSNANFEYSYNLTNWYTLNGSGQGTTNTFDAAANTVYLRGNNLNGLNADIYSVCGLNILIQGGIIPIKISGRLLDLIDNGNGTINSISSIPYCFKGLFYGSLITDASKLELPNTTSESCFCQLFNSCTSLTQAPSLPATILTKRCYEGMFAYCASLIIAPELPATALAEGCYSYMFQGCASLTQAPTLATPTLAEGCYANMFNGCTSLTQTPTLPALTLVYSCYLQMFMGCSNLSKVICLCTDSVEPTSTLYWLQDVAPVGTFIQAEGAIWARGDTGIPEGWSVRNYREQNNLCAGNDKVNNIILGGDTQIKKVYLGNTLLWEIGMLYVKSGVTTIPISCGNMTFKEYTTYDFGNGAEQAIHLQKTESHSGSTSQGGWSVTFTYDAYVKRHISISQMIANTSYSLKGTKNSLEYTYSWSDADYNNYFEIR